MSKQLAKTVLLLFLVGLSAIFFVACSGGSSSKARPKYKPDLGDTPTTQIEVFRFEQELALIDTTNISQGLEKLKEKHGDFAKTFFETVICDNIPTDREERIGNFLAIPELRQLIDSTIQYYPNFDSYKKQLEELLRYKDYYFGQEVFPIRKVFTFISLYKYGAFALDDYAALGLDFFLGEEHIGYPGVENLRHQYIRRTLNQAHMIGTLAAYIANALVEEQAKMQGNKMIDHMIYKGKEFFVKAALIPNAHDSLIYNFSEYQLLYCRQGEAALWEHLGKENLLYSTDFNKFRKYVEIGPFNPQFDLPGNSAAWLGTQLVMIKAENLRKELKTSQPNISTRERDRQVMSMILQENDPQRFVQKYRPNK